VRLIGWQALAQTSQSNAVSFVDQLNQLQAQRRQLWGAFNECSVSVMLRAWFATISSDNPIEGECNCTTEKSNMTAKIKLTKQPGGTPIERSKEPNKINGVTALQVPASI